MRRIRFDQSKSFTRVIIRIAIVAVGISLSVILLASALISGFKKEITSKVYGFWGHIHITTAAAENSVDATPISLNEEFLSQLKQIDAVEYDAAVRDGRQGKRELTETKGGIQDVRPYINLPAMLSTREQYEGIVLRGFGTGHNWSQYGAWLVEGDTLQIEPDTVKRDLIISKYTSNRLNLKVDDYVIISFFRDNREVKRRMRVKGIYNTGLEEYDKKYAIVDYRIMQDVLGWKRSEVSGIELTVEHLEDIEILTDYIYIEVLPAKLFAESIQSLYPNIFEWLNLFDMNERFLFIVLVVVAFINMVTVLIILIMERTPMIGVLKALGARNRQVQSVFIRLAVRIIIRGLLIGNLAALIIGYAQYKFKFISLDESSYYLSYAPVSFDLAKWIGLNLGALVLIVIFLTIPSLLILGIRPVKAIKFK